MSRHLMLITTRSTELPAPVVGQSIIYPKADGLWYSRDENGVETLMSGGSFGGSGTVNKISKFTTATIVGDSIIFDDGTSVGIGTITGLAKLSINGGLHVGGDSDPGDNNLTVDGVIISGLINGQTISAVANFTGTVAIATSLNITGSLQVDSIVNDTGLAHGTYTPTLTNILNLDSSTARVCLYTRVGNNVIVHGLFTVDPTTSNTVTILDLSLPIASNFTLSSDLSGILKTSGAFADDKGGHCVANVTDNRATFTWYPVVSGSTDMYFTFQYQIK